MAVAPPNRMRQNFDPSENELYCLLASDICEKIFFH